MRALAGIFSKDPRIVADTTEAVQRFRSLGLIKSRSSNLRRVQMGERQGPVLALEALETIDKIKSSEIANSGPCSMYSFWDPSAWPDLLCAYQGKARVLAIVHVWVAAALTLLSWKVTGISWYWSCAAHVWTHFPSPEDKTFATFLLFAMFSCQTALPLVYLWAVRYHNLCAGSSKEAPTLQADIKAMLQAVASLRTNSEVPNNILTDDPPSACPRLALPCPHPCGDQSDPADTSSGQASLTSEPAAQQHSSTDPEDSASTARTAAGGLTDPVDPFEAAGQGASQPDQALIIRPEQRIPTLETVETAAEEHEAGIMHMQAKYCQLDANKVSARPCSAYQKECKNPPAAGSSGDDAQSENFRARVAAALKASSHIIANLTARLESMVYYRCGVVIQGHAECSAALAILNGQECLPETLPEALAAIKIIGAAWPARNPRTPISQFWRPSAWADYIHAYSPFDRALLEPADFYIPGHVLVDPYRFFFSMVAGMSFVLDPACTLWFRVAILGGMASMLHNSISSRIHAALKRNLTVKQHEISTNMPNLIHHLRQLVTAYGIIQEHILRTSTEPDARATSSIALMHATGIYHSVRWNLLKRLTAAARTCFESALSECSSNAGAAAGHKHTCSYDSQSGLDGSH
ncbi:hypothetical protein WJX74_007527 [Apatococcus lobatus]|uniref:Odorant receptor n=1 Tax=Apatococcus lobatus TaxID=904363 RepID=A0AAW1R1U7_9CHLO